MRTPRFPAAPPPPPAPSDDEGPRLAAEREAVLAQKTAGRRSTIHAGADMAEQEQMTRGLESMNRRLVAISDEGGGAEPRCAWRRAASVAQAKAQEARRDRGARGETPRE